MHLPRLRERWPLSSERDLDVGRQMQAAAALTARHAVASDESSATAAV